jgi:hypothetical protein
MVLASSSYCSAAWFSIDHVTHSDLQAKGRRRPDRLHSPALSGRAERMVEALDVELTQDLTRPVMRDLSVSYNKLADLAP